ncbi:double-strand break repair protein AddB [Aliishimia ponticola]|uniref:Double-strand break repair protein AddB n=1 Tax=Aliishimia ponticola TaxID=2499833 RepID=A0A4S4NEY3_9RHOB|nr:double-strand break repair protein AddB [Aliishimia ponticola]THH34630.1 double-strand break repair protein AddB [Aliishimia ponticola]
MHDAGTGPHLFMEPLGADFLKALRDGLLDRVRDQPPEALAKITVIVNTSRMRRRLQSLFIEGPAGFLPKILLLSDLDKLLTSPPPPPARDPLRRRLQLAQLIAPVLEAHPELGAQASVFALADSLASLMDEMQGEGVDAATIAALDVSDQSGHWKNAQTLFGIAHNYVSAIDDGQDNEARQRGVVQALIEQWAETPPTDPIILAGSTGSRGTTALLMKAIAGLPNGAVVLPGFDADIPDDVWHRMTDALSFEDHPQFRFARLMHDLGVGPGHIRQWSDTQPCAQDRSRVVSLALRPAPVTDAWLREGPSLSNLPEALGGITIVEASSQRIEALSIAMRMRKAAEDGQTVALITPDRMLGRQVSTALDRWNIVPDDSGGAPLHLSAPGRFLRHVAELFRHPLDAQILLTLLKHPLTQTGDAFPEHGLRTQQLEAKLRRDRVPFPGEDDLVRLSSKGEDDTWTAWLCSCFCGQAVAGELPLTDWLARHRALAEAIAGPDAGELWKKAAGQEAAKVFAALEENAEHGGAFSAQGYAQLFASVLSQAEARDRDEPHPGVMIWGTLEARVQGADLVILGGLNEGVWPEPPSADPWLNRQMRQAAGLLLPDRRIGLSAHDFQQAVAAPEVWITRAIRSDDAETVPSRWVNRLTNMISGLDGPNGPEALRQMRARGQEWLNRVTVMETVQRTRPAGRAAPVPPVAARPRDFSVTEIKTLIRDPYAIYAKKILRLKPLDPLVQEPDAPLRGILIHDIMERFIKDVMRDSALLTQAHLMEIVDSVLEKDVPWSTTRLLWRARMARVAEWIVEGERERLSIAQPAAMEHSAQGRITLPSIGSSIQARADRIDLTETGEAVLYDYKSGKPPSKNEQLYFDRQLLIEAAMIENGGFEALGPRTVADAAYIGLGSKPERVPAPLDEEPPSKTLAGLVDLLSAYLDPDQHYLSRRAVRQKNDIGYYDQLARHGEWDDVDDPSREDLT